MTAGKVPTAAAPGRAEPIDCAHSAILPGGIEMKKKIPEAMLLWEQLEKVFDRCLTPPPPQPQDGR
jgi:hypothetical protein